MRTTRNGCIRFRPLAGIVHEADKLKWTAAGFRPLTGMVSTSFSHGYGLQVSAPLRGWYRLLSRMAMDCKFPPPYGDCTAEYMVLDGRKAFSPPYGDGILNISQNTAKLKSRMAGKYSLYYNDVLLR